MKKKEKIDKLLKGEPIENMAACFWRHFYNAEHDISMLADALINFQKKYNWDFIKINPRASYHIEDWDCRYDYSKAGKPVRMTYPVKQIADWRRLTPLNVYEGILADHLRIIKMIKDEFSDDVPVIQTIFLPIEIAARLCGNRILFRQHIRESPGTIEYAMDVILATFIEYARQCLKAGADGFFLATKCAGYDYLDDLEFINWHKNYDEKFLHAIGTEGKLLILHICGKNIRLNEMMNYPVNILHWDNTIPGNPSMETVRSRTEKTIIGGTSNNYFHELTINEHIALINNIRCKKRWILGAECVLEAPYNEEMLEVISRMRKYSVS